MATKKGEQKAKLDAIGIDAVCELILEGASRASIARKFGMSQSSFINWLAADPDRSVRAREAMVESSELWNERAETVLIEADETVPGAIAKAKELSQLYRWRAKCYAPKRFGDKVAVGGDPESPLQVAHQWEAGQLANIAKGFLVTK